MKPKVIILSTFLSPFRSGAEACVEEVALRLAEDFDITIITARLKRELPKKDMLEGKVPIRRVGLGNALDKWLFPFLAALACRGMARYAPPGQKIILHAVLETFAGLALHFCGGIVPGAKRILTLQTTNRSFLKGPIIRSPHAVTAISSALTHIAKRKGRKEVTLIPNGIDLSLVPAIERVPDRMLSVGRLEKMKGVDVLLRAYAEIRTDLTSGAELRIVGDGGERAALTQLAAKLGILDRVKFVGRISHRDVYTEYAQAEIFCSLPRSEALGNVFLEAEACGCAILATNVGGIPDIVEDGVTGLLIPPDDLSAAVKGLRRLLKDSTFRKTLGDAGQKQAKYFDWSNIAMQYKKVYENVLV